MERLILNQLLNWKNYPYRKPLILKGVRQDAFMKTPPTLTSMKMKNINNFLKLRKM